MGIKSNFNKFLKSYCGEDIYTTVNLSEYAYKKIAIDISLYLHKYKVVCGDDWIKAFINLVICLRKNNIHCVFIYDGKAPDEKDSEHEDRKIAKDKLRSTLKKLEESLELYHSSGELNETLLDLIENRRSPSKKILKRDDIDIEWITEKIEYKRKQIVNISQDDLNLTRELFTLLKIPFYIAPTEAEKMCSKLCIDGVVDAVLTEDTDVIAYASPVFLSKIDTFKGTCQELIHSQILERLELDNNEFLDLCIMCGTDYNKNLPKIGAISAYKKIRVHRNIENIRDVDKLNVDILKHTVVRRLFTDFSDIDVKRIPFCGRPDIMSLNTFFDKYGIDVDVTNLIHAFTYNDSIVFS
jgi:5'-3' exonuclease